MNKIANILFDKSKDISELYNVCDYDTMIPGIPTIIVGWENVKQKYPNKSIIGWQIDSLTYWTFGKREKRDRYERDMTEFKKIALKYLKKNIQYHFFDLFNVDSEQDINLGHILRSSDNTVYQTYDMVYIYNKDKNVVLGISISEIEYAGKSKGKLFDVIRQYNPTGNHFITNEIPFDLKNQLRNSKYLIPYLYS